ncbi:hypothetical protein GCM10010168_86270 [Actinoplanes ianthinogenes]|uniref:Uncharacterized protein n=1 Tax=Actinoplanes ianthinogenes TaxID=122358 RepID=A0ABM7M181_9ACTN|nr:hypothetical protein [Actinoplanes ianthinogenes]BCJ45358.1 hypothetical protein Aiant_60150 [Actinoplanes ianthinogenes]GGR53995.1 hypothetical protein GCM10010168_86270 [Actinoplanes ianthinogenes]
MRLRHVTTKYVFDASALPVTRDAKRRKFQPADVIVTHRSTFGFWEVRVHGFTTNTMPYSTSVIWGIKNDQVLENNVGQAPGWLKDVVAQAVRLHAAAGVALAGGETR